MQDTESHLSVSKRISLFLARKSPQHTIDTLVYEIQKMQADDDALATPKAHRHTPVGTCLQHVHNWRKMTQQNCSFRLYMSNAALSLCRCCYYVVAVTEHAIPFCMPGISI